MELYDQILSLDFDQKFAKSSLFEKEKPPNLLGSLVGPQGMLEGVFRFLGRSSEVPGGFWVIP